MSTRGIALWAVSTRSATTPRFLPHRTSCPHLRTSRATIVADTAVWLATTGEIADWWRVRAQLDARVTQRADGFDVIVRNRGERLVGGAVLRLDLPSIASARWRDGSASTRASWVGALAVTTDSREFNTHVPDLLHGRASTVRVAGAKSDASSPHGPQAQTLLVASLLASGSQPSRAPRVYWLTIRSGRSRSRRRPLSSVTTTVRR